MAIGGIGSPIGRQVGDPPQFSLFATLTAQEGAFVLTGEGALFEIELNLNASYPAGPAGIGSPIGRYIGGVEYLREAGVGLFEVTGKDTVLTPAIVATTAGYVLSGADVAFIVNPPVVDTDRLDLPINCVLARTQLFKDRFRENSIFAPSMKEKVAATSSGVTRLKGTKPSFTVKTGTKGYD